MSKWAADPPTKIGSKPPLLILFEYILRLVDCSILSTNYSHTLNINTIGSQKNYGPLAIKVRCGAIAVKPHLLRKFVNLLQATAIKWNRQMIYQARMEFRVESCDSSITIFIRFTCSSSFLVSSPLHCRSFSRYDCTSFRILLEGSSRFGCPDFAFCSCSAIQVPANPFTFSH
jgi:hypothetical protein